MLLILCVHHRTRRPTAQIPASDAPGAAEMMAINLAAHIGIGTTAVTIASV